MPPLAVPPGTRPDPVLPPRGRHLVRRLGLDALLDAAVDAPVVVVSAPAGAGKTAALLDLASRWDGPVAWCSLDRRHDDPAVFWRSVADVLGIALDDHAARPDSVVDALADRDERRLLVLDDYHVVGAPEVHAGMARLVAGGWPLLHVVLATRHDPPLPLGRWRAERTLSEVRFEDLRFDEAELGALLDHVTGVTLGPEHVRSLHQRTEGWAAGVHLAALSLGQQHDVDAFVAGFAGDDRHIADYLRDEVLSRVPGEVQTFLLETALLDRLTAPLCEAVTGRAGAQELLEEVERRNLFLVPLDHRRRWYRYHHLFAEWLRLRPPPGLQERHRRAASWYEAQQLPGDALPHHIAAGDVDLAADLVERERWVLVGQARQATLREWVALLPADVLGARPALATAAAWVAYDQGRWDEVGRLADVLASGTAAPGGDGDPLLRAETALLAAGRLAALGQLDAAGRTAAAGLELVPAGEPRGRTGLLLVSGKSRQAAGDLAAARAAFLEAEALATTFGVHVVELIAVAHLAELDRLDGRSTAGRRARAALDLAARHGLSDHPECAVAEMTLAHLLVDAGQPEDAARHVERASHLVERIPYQPRAAALAGVRTRLDGAVPRGDRRSTAAQASLTGQESALLRLLPSSLTTREIAGELYLSVNTVKTHARTLYRKLGVQTRHAAIEEARSQGLL